MNESPSQKVVITGINGFVGHHLAKRLKSDGHTVIGIGHDEKVFDTLEEIVDEYHQADLSETWPEITDADGVIHLAGLAAVGPSFDDPQRYINMNSAMVTHMCEYYTKQDKKPRIIVVSSGAIYDPHQSMPLNESANIGFSSPYAVSKVLVENQCNYYRNRGLDCIIVRPFNHIGPGQGLGFILPDFYDRLSKLQDSSASISVGNIETRRDYTDVRDIVDAYTRLVTTPELKETIYNVCSGASLSGREVLDQLKAAMSLDSVSFEVDPTLVRPTDIENIVGDSSRLQSELGWMPTHSIKQTIQDFVASKS